MPKRWKRLWEHECHGRSDTPEVQESTHTRPQHHFGRASTALHLGDFLQPKPTCSISLMTDANELSDYGSF
eukprot:7781096-Pyramimonas_sp.AAC.1